MIMNEFTECQHGVNKDVAEMFLEDIKFMQILENRTELVSGHYQIPLQFTDDKVNLPNNCSQAEKRSVYL